MTLILIDLTFITIIILLVFLSIATWLEITTIGKAISYKMSKRLGYEETCEYEGKTMNKRMWKNKYFIGEKIKFRGSTPIIVGEITGINLHDEEIRYVIVGEDTKVYYLTEDSIEAVNETGNA